MCTPIFLRFRLHIPIDFSPLSASAATFSQEHLVNFSLNGRNVPLYILQGLLIVALHCQPPHIGGIQIIINSQMTRYNDMKEEVV